jgi:hypothetical protein
MSDQPNRVVAGKKQAIAGRRHGADFVATHAGKVEKYGSASVDARERAGPPVHP